MPKKTKDQLTLDLPLSSAKEPAGGSESSSRVPRDASIHSLAERKAARDKTAKSVHFKAILALVKHFK